MAGSLQLYTLLFGAVNGTLLAEEQQIDVTRSANAQIVNTVAKGFAGVSPGAAMTEVDVKNAIPAGGFEIDFGQNIAGLIPVDVQVRGPGGKTLSGKAFVLNDSIRHGVNQEASYDFKAVMPLSLFKN
jgi:hypothetical protein